MPYIGRIMWDVDPVQVQRGLKSFMLQVIGDLGIVLSAIPNDAATLTRGWLAGAVSDEKMKEACLEWWNTIDSNDWTRPYGSPARRARLNVFLLHIGAEDIALTLEWFLDFLDVPASQDAIVNDCMARCFRFADR